jgi:hypothetical protein
MLTTIENREKQEACNTCVTALATTEKALIIEASLKAGEDTL